MTDVATLLAAWTAADPDRWRRVAADRRALVAAEAHAALGVHATNTDLGDLLGVSYQRAWQLRQTAAAVHADPDRLAAALALGGPIPGI